MVVDELLPDDNHIFAVDASDKHTSIFYMNKLLEGDFASVLEKQGKFNEICKTPKS